MVGQLEDGRSALLYLGDYSDCSSKCITMHKEVVGVWGLQWENNYSLLLLQLNGDDEISIARFGRQKSKPRMVGCLCAKCGKMFSNRRNLGDHTKLHTTDGVRVCPHCGVALADEYFLKIHASKCHRPCPFASIRNCKFSSKHEDALKRHIARFHRHDVLQ